MKRETISQFLTPVNPHSVRRKIDSGEVPALADLNDTFAEVVIRIADDMPRDMPNARVAFVNYAWKAYVIAMGAFGEHVIQPKMLAEKVDIPNMVEHNPLPSD